MESAASIFRIKDCAARQIEVLNGGTLTTRYMYRRKNENGENKEDKKSCRSEKGCSRESEERNEDERQTYETVNYSHIKMTNKEKENIIIL